MGYTRQQDIASAFGDSPVQRNVIQNLYDRVVILENSVVPPGGTPPAMQWGVAGQDGDFIVTINLPSQTVYPSLSVKTMAQGANPLLKQSTVITHQIQSSTNTLFDVNGDTRTYGPDTKTTWWITDTPNTNRYFRLRSSYDGGKTWNPWVVFEDPIICGVAPVFSGQVRAIRQYSNAQTNVTNFCTVDSIAQGGLATIRVYGSGGVGTGWTRPVADDTTEGPFPAALLPGYALATTYDVYWDATFSIYRVFLHTDFLSQLPNRYRYAGTVTTIASGGVTLPTAHANIAGGSVVSIVIDDPGSGMSSAPTVVITPALGDPGTGAEATCTLTGGAANSIVVNKGGINYAAAPTISFTGGSAGAPGGGGTSGGRGGYVGGSRLGL